MFKVNKDRKMLMEKAKKLVIKLKECKRKELLREMYKKLNPAHLKK